MASKTRLTLDDFWEMPGTDTLHELVNGEPLEMPGANWTHGSIVAAVGCRLKNHVDSLGAGHVLVQAGFVLPLPDDREHLRIPDAAFVSAERVPGGRVERWFVGAPDLAIEVLSPSDKSQEVQQKVQEYFATGARLVWVIAPAARSATVYRADGSARLVREDEALLGEDLLPDLVIPLSELLP